MVLGVFFTRGVSLKKWVDAGLFDREVQIYREHLSSGLLSQVYWFTYGGSDHQLAERLVAEGRLPASIQVIQWPNWLSIFGRGASAIYSLLMPFLARKYLRRCDLYKTNQMEGAIAAVLSSVLWKRPLYVRTGYTLSRVVERIFPGNPLRRFMAYATEYIGFQFGGISSVSSKFDFYYVRKRYHVPEEKLAIVGNYVDTDAFGPSNASGRLERVVYVGRLSPEKNLGMAIRACQKSHIGLDIIGEGSERPYLEDIVREIDADVRWLGVVTNDQLPQILAGYKYFILPSLWEGMPKALLEAMASGLVCIGNDTTGINEVIEDGINGYLSRGPEAEQLAKAIQRAMSGDQVKVSAAARSFVDKSYSLGAIAAREREILTKISGASPRIPYCP